jgi:hypothetical protein
MFSVQRFITVTIIAQTTKLTVEQSIIERFAVLLQGRVCTHSARGTVLGTRSSSDLQGLKAERSAQGC